MTRETMLLLEETKACLRDLADSIESGDLDDIHAVLEERADLIELHLAAAGVGPGVVVK